MEAAGIDPNAVPEGGEGEDGDNPLIDDGEGANRPILPYSSFFCLGTENPYVIDLVCHFCSLNSVIRIIPNKKIL